MEPVEAQYHGNCRECGGHIVAGDSILRAPDDEGWVHAQCATPAQGNAVVCERCHLLKPCGCDDA